MPRTLNIRIDADMDRAIDAAARQKKLSRSEVARALLRRTLGLVDTNFDNGYMEGKIKGEREYLEKIGRASAAARR